MKDNTSINPYSSLNDPLPSDLKISQKNPSPRQCIEEASQRILLYNGIQHPIIKDDSKSEDSEELITIIVRIGKGKEETIIIHNKDEAGELANKFASKYNLSEHMKAKLKERIQESINEELGNYKECPENISEDDSQSNIEAENLAEIGRASCRERVSSPV